MTKTTNLEKLKALRDHLIEMDSGSGDAELLTWAIGEIAQRKSSPDISTEEWNDACAGLGTKV